MIFGSVCSGIEAASEAWVPLGWHCAYVAEIEPFPCHVLNQRHGASRPMFMPDPDGPFPLSLTDPVKIEDERKARIAAIRAVRDLPDAGRNTLPNVGDFTRLDPNQFDLPDVLIGGTPCQGFSIAGLRKSLGDDRSNLALEFVRLAYATDALREQRGLPGLIVVWENVPDVMSVSDNAFGCLLAGFIGANEPLAIRGSWPSSGMARGPRARAAWCVLNAQYFGLAQRRERVFLVVSFRDGADPSTILFERQSVYGNFAPGGEAWEDVAGTITASLGSRSAEEAERGTLVPEIAGALRTDCFASEDGSDQQPTLIAHIPPIVPQAMSAKWSKGSSGPSGPSGNEVANLVAFSANDYGNGAANDLAPTLRAMGHKAGSKPNAGEVMAVAFSHAQITSPTNRSNRRSAAGGQPTAEAISDEPFVFEARYARNGRGAPESVVPPLKAQSGETGKGDAAPLVAIPILEPGARTGDHSVRAGLGIGEDGDPMFTLQAKQQHDVATDADSSRQWVVRKLTLTECEKLQGFRPGYTAIVWRGRPPEECPDGPRYKSLGNSFPVPIIGWIGERIQKVVDSNGK